MKIEYAVDEISNIALRMDGIVFCKGSCELVVCSNLFGITLASMSCETIIPMGMKTIINTSGLTEMFGIPSSMKNSKAERVEVIWNM